MGPSYKAGIIRGLVAFACEAEECSRCFYHPSKLCLQLLVEGGILFEAAVSSHTPSSPSFEYLLGKGSERRSCRLQGDHMPVNLMI